LLTESPELMLEIGYYWLCTGKLHSLSPHDWDHVLQRIGHNRWLFELAAHTPAPLRPAIPYVLKSAEKLRSFFSL
jgi:hypothetical protein